MAYEVSLQLAKRGVQVQGVLLIDSPSPINHIPLSESVIDSVLALQTRRAGSKLEGLVKAQFVMNARMLGKYNPRATSEHSPSLKLVLLRSKEGYDPPSISGTPTWLTDRKNPKSASAGWETIAGEPIKVMDIPGHHFQPFEASHV